MHEPNRPGDQPVPHRQKTIGPAPRGDFRERSLAREIPPPKIEPGGVLFDRRLESQQQKREDQTDQYDPLFDSLDQLAMQTGGVDPVVESYPQSDMTADQNDEDRQTDESRPAQGGYRGAKVALEDSKQQVFPRSTTR